MGTKPLHSAQISLEGTPRTLTLEGAAVAAEEARLLQEVGAGDRGTALRLLYRRYEKLLFSLGVRLLQDRQLAQELVQDTFFRVCRKAHTFDPSRGSARTFILVVFHRIAIDLQRRRAARPAESAFKSDEPAREEDISRVLDAIVVQDALNALSLAHRQVLELSYRGSLRQTEIAELLGIPLGTVKTRVYYALKAFKLALEERGVHA